MSHSHNATIYLNFEAETEAEAEQIVEEINNFLRRMPYADAPYIEEWEVDSYYGFDSDAEEDRYYGNVTSAQSRYQERFGDEDIPF